MRRSDTGDLSWKSGVFYCADVETFYAWNGDGCGDIRGMTERIEYLFDLGVTCLWLMPFYPTARRDDGYDITDFFVVDPRLGTHGDFVELVRTAKATGIRVTIDFVMNHTSDGHPWFKSARRSKDDPYRDYYVWSATKPKSSRARKTSSSPTRRTASGNATPRRTSATFTISTSTSPTSTSPTPKCRRRFHAYWASGLNSESRASASSPSPSCSPRTCADGSPQCSAATSGECGWPIRSPSPCQGLRSSLRRGDQDGRKPPHSRTTRRMHAHAVDRGRQRRLFQGPKAEADPSPPRRPLRSEARQRRRPASRPPVFSVGSYAISSTRTGSSRRSAGRRPRSWSSPTRRSWPTYAPRSRGGRWSRCTTSVQTAPSCRFSCRAFRRAAPSSTCLTDSPSTNWIPRAGSTSTLMAMATGGCA